MRPSIMGCPSSDSAETKIVGVALPVLADTVDTAEALFKAVGFQRQVVVDHQVAELEVDAFARGLRRDAYAVFRLRQGYGGHDGVSVAPCATGNARNGRIGRVQLGLAPSTEYPYSMIISTREYQMNYIPRVADREILTFIEDSQDNKNVLLVEGARQVGKSFLVEHALRKSPKEMGLAESRKREPIAVAYRRLPGVQGVRTTVARPGRFRCHRRSGALLR